MRRRPFLVWLVFVVYLMIIMFDLLRLVNSLGPVLLESSAARRWIFFSYFAYDLLIILAWMLLQFSAVVSLFLMKRIAVLLFGLLLAWSTWDTGISLFRIWAAYGTEPVDGPNLAGILVAWLIIVTLFLYAHRLDGKEMLH